LEESRSKETGGFGLGLSIARSIVHGHGGEITLGNRAGIGLRATITLPPLES
jgi:signal transduction histidine kinase